MTFTIRIKEEITLNKPDILSARVILLAYLKYAAIVENNKITITIENANIARYIYRLLKMIYNVSSNHRHYKESEEWLW